ncbi:hypothetical protein ABM34_09810 [Companilactobacillus ginsenosidimutans]|uniref:Uncharacterized protein n=2 Tax=Companilactobacillus ginsenosidimutans TaxID=1007676 RepID=A0A0H4QM58_9LACO|nr:hypothetical protein ABM34_09810 [Companilactobacillus ginsenosidimutans]
MPEDAYSAYYLFLDPNGTFQLRESTTFGNPKTYHNYDLPDGDIPPTFSDTIFEGNYTVINSDIISLVSDSTAIFSYDNDNYLNNPTRKRIVASKFNVDFTRSQDQSYFAQKYPQVSTGGIAQDYNVKIKLSIYKGMAIAGISQVGINTGDIKYYIYHSDGKRDPQSLEQLYNFDVVYNHSLY